MKLSRRSPVTGKINTMEIPTSLARLDAYVRGNKPIQDALPELNNEQREFVLTGMTPTDWATTFPYGDKE